MVLDQQLTKVGWEHCTGQIQVTIGNLYEFSAWLTVDQPSTFNASAGITSGRTGRARVCMRACVCV